MEEELHLGRATWWECEQVLQKVDTLKKWMGDRIMGSEGTTRVLEKENW